MSEKIKYRDYSITSHGKKFKFWNGEKQVSIDTLDSAKAAIDELITRKNTADQKSQLPVISVTDALVKFAEHAKMKSMDVTTIKNVNIVWGKIQTTWLHDVNRQVILDTINENPNWSDSTRRQKLLVMRSLIRFAKDNGYLVDEAVFKLPLPAVYESVEPKIAATEEDTQKVLDHARTKEHWCIYQLTSFICKTGCRPATIEHLKKTDYDKEKKLVKAIGGNSKNRTPIYIPVTPDLESLLDRAVVCNRNEYLFNNSRGKKWAMDSIANVMKKYKGIGIVRKEISWYSWRLKKDNELISLGVNAFDHAKITGHNIQTISKHYHKLDMGNIISSIENKERFKYYDGTKEHVFDTLQELNDFYNNK